MKINVYGFCNEVFNLRSVTMIINFAVKLAISDGVILFGVDFAFLFGCAIA